MKQPFDPGPVDEPFKALAADYPGEETYPPDDFRVEWGPIFHRGRLDGSAKVLIIGQDPGQHESIARRILVGEAGQRTQGFLAKLGIERSYVMVNAFLYSVYGQQGGEKHKDDPAIAAYRNRWLDALLDSAEIEAVISFGQLGRHAFESWRETPVGAQADVSFEPLTHPTMPEASSKGDKAKKATATKKMLTQWNGALERLDHALGERDVQRELVPYGEDLLPGDRAQIPAADLPAGSPPWMSSVKQWATRTALTRSTDRKAREESKRATVVVTVPRDERPWHDD
jgi:uracil-DNA glycosylase